VPALPAHAGECPAEEGGKKKRGGMSGGEKGWELIHSFIHSPNFTYEKNWGNVPMPRAGVSEAGEKGLTQVKLFSILGKSEHFDNPASQHRKKPISRSVFFYE